MALLYDCTNPALKGTENDYCPEDFGQVQRIFVQKQRDAAAGADNYFVISDPGLPTEVNEIESLTAWQAAISALNGASPDAGIVQSPFITAPTTEPGAPRTYGGGNETLDGIELVIGSEPTLFTANILSMPQATAIKALKSMMTANVSVYLVDEFGRIGYMRVNDDNGNGTGYDSFGRIRTVGAYGFPVKSFFIGDKNLGGFESPDMNALQFNLPPNWSDNFAIAVPDFNPLDPLPNA